MASKPKSKHKKRKSPEYDLQLQLVDYVIDKYPNVILSSDLGGIRLPIGLLVKINKLKWGSNKQGQRFLFPDFSLPYEARGGWYSLSIELKESKASYRLKSGLIRNNKHIQEQAQALKEIRGKNHYGDFAGGFDEATSLVDWYMGLSKTPIFEVKLPTWGPSVFNK